MKEQNYIKLEFPSRSSNEFFARSAVAAFAAAAQAPSALLDPAVMRAEPTGDAAFRRAIEPGFLHHL